MSSEHPVVVIGAGPAGIAAALSLRDRGVRPLVVDRADTVASSWWTRYDRLKLNTGRHTSHLPRRRYPRGTPTFPTRDQVVEHLQLHARLLDIQLNTAAERIDRRPSGWRLQTPDGHIDARQVIVATGYEHAPHVPPWPGIHGYTGELLHSSQYRNARPYVGKRVMVVGCGSSGMEIAHDLATGGSSKVWLTVRTPPNIMLRTGPAGLPGDAIASTLYHLPSSIADRIARRARLHALGDLSQCGLPIPDEGPFSRLARLGVAPSVVDIEVIEAIRDRAIELVHPPGSFDGDTASLVDGTQLEPDAVVCATGYRCDLQPLVGHLKVLDERGAPRFLAPAAAAPGLRFLGFLSRPSLIGYVAKQSRRMAREIANELR